MKNTQSPKITLVVLAIILCIQMIFFLYFGSQKSGFHEDEMATYTLSNFSDGFISRSNDLIGQWVDGGTLHDTLSVSGEEAFNYEMVYRNQESDVHPPLFYYVVHTLASFFPGHFSKWFGILPNIAFSLLTSVIMFFISKRLLKNDFLALMVVIGWGFSIGAIDSATFIRMYAMLTLWTVLFVYLHLKAFDCVIKKKKIPVLMLILLFLCTFCGLMTQYYFSIFALFLCCSFFLYLAGSRRWRDLGLYVFAEFCAIGTAFVYYPAMYNHIFGGGYRGQEAFTNLKNADNFFGSIRSAFELISNDMLNGWTKALLSFCVVMIVIGLFSKLFKLSIRYVTSAVEFQVVRISDLGMNGTLRVSVETLIVGVIILVLSGYSILVSKVAPYLQDRYYMCLYPIFTLSVVFIISKTFSFVLNKQILSYGLTFAAVLIVTVSGLAQQTPSYLYPEATVRTAALEVYSDKPVVVLNGAYSWYATHWLDEYDIFSEVYLCRYSKNDFSQIKDAFDTNDLTDGFILYALRFSNSDDEIIQKVKEFIPVKNYSVVCTGMDRVFYCTLEE